MVSIMVSVSLGAHVPLVGPMFHVATFEVGLAELTIEFGGRDAPVSIG
jgi:hypothetical protein